MARDDPHFRLRIPEDLKAQIEASAKANNRSMNAEIVSRLERSFDIEGELTEVSGSVEDHEYRLAKLEERVEDLMYFVGKWDPNPPK